MRSLVVAGALSSVLACVVVDDAQRPRACVVSGAQELAPPGTSSEGSTLVVPIVVHYGRLTWGDGSVRDAFADQVFAATDHLDPYGVAPVVVDEVWDDHDELVLRGGDADDITALTAANYDEWDDGRLHVYVVAWIYDASSSMSYEGFYHRLVQPCSHVVLVTDDAAVDILTHELGHVLDLRHVADASNVMYPYSIAGVALRPEQGEAARAAALDVVPACWGP